MLITDGLVMAVTRSLLGGTTIAISEMMLKLFYQLRSTLVNVLDAVRKKQHSHVPITRTITMLESVT